MLSALALNFSSLAGVLAADEDVAVAGGLFGTLVYLAFIVVFVAAYWVIFQKAGKPGWAAIVPIYNIIVMLQIVNRPGWWFLLMLIPFVNFVVMILVMLDFAKAFGRSTAFGLGLIFLAPIFFLILAFGGSRYVGINRPVAQPA
jgi:hypothetical protein